MTDFSLKYICLDICHILLLLHDFRNFMWNSVEQEADLLLSGRLWWQKKLQPLLYYMKMKTAVINMRDAICFIRLYEKFKLG